MGSWSALRRVTETQMAASSGRVCFHSTVLRVDSGSSIVDASSAVLLVFSTGYADDVIKGAHLLLVYSLQEGDSRLVPPILTTTARYVMLHPDKPDEIGQDCGITGRHISTHLSGKRCGRAGACTHDLRYSTQCTGTDECTLLSQQRTRFLLFPADNLGRREVLAKGAGTL